MRTFPRVLFLGGGDGLISQIAGKGGSASGGSFVVTKVVISQPISKSSVPVPLISSWHSSVSCPKSSFEHSEPKWPSFFEYRIEDWMAIHNLSRDMVCGHLIAVASERTVVDVDKGRTHPLCVTACLWSSYKTPFKSFSDSANMICKSSFFVLFGSSQKITESHVPKSMRLTSFVSFFDTTPVTILRIAGENSASYS